MVFIVTILVAVLTILSIWLFGLGSHRTLFENSFLSTSVLSLVFFFFLSVGLFKGIKLKDNIGKLTDKLKLSKIPNLADATPGNAFIDVGDGIAGIVLSVVLWIVVTILIGVFLWLFGAILWSGIIVFVAMLYWIFFRAIRLVFKNSSKCKGKLSTSMVYALAYTVFYSFWIYGIVLAAHYLL